MYPEAPENGIYIFHDDVQVGADAVEVLGLHDVVFEYEITSNRVDCYSVVGIAREAAATFNKEFKPPVVTETGNNEDVNDYVKVSVENTNLCSRYCARVVKNIKIWPFTGMDAAETCIRWNPSDQQSRRYYQLCNGRVWTADACI